MPESDISYIDMIDGYVMLNNGVRLPITNRFDADGDELPSDEVSLRIDSIVAGPTPDGKWRHIFVERKRIN